ncbi:MAG: glycoside hydrolase family 9 protein, partial [Lachnospiraceae bacterium]|nr:glycoside hydrolase family 9 protein [Lachnospiraceae bacterium]
IFIIASSTFPCIGFVLFGLAIPRAFLSRKEYPILSYVDIMLAAAFVFAVGATNIMPWEKVAKYFGFLQFPWRLFAISSALLAMADAIIIKLFINTIDDQKRNAAFEIALTVIMIITAGGAIAHQNANSMGYYDYSDDYYSYKPFTRSVIAGEWLPVTVTEPEKLIDQSEKMVYDNGKEAEFERIRGAIVSDVAAGHKYADVPFIYYKGYEAVLTDANGAQTRLTVTGEGENGLCRVMLDGKQGQLIVSYKGTVLQLVSLIVSHLFLILIFDMWYLKNKYKKKLKDRAAAAGANLGRIACIVLVASATFLSGCSVSIKENPQPAGKFNDPEDVIDYLNKKNNVFEEEEIEALVKVNCSHRGYDANGQSYAVLIDERTGEQVISVISLEEAKLITSENIRVINDLYKDLLREEVASVTEKYRTDSISDRIMNETDALLCLEVFPEKAKSYGIDELAVILADDLLAIPGSKADEVLDKYACSAVLAKAAYVLQDWDRAAEALELSELFFQEAELEAATDTEPVAARMWAAAELYRLTGLKTYRSVVDAIAMDTIPQGFTYSEPGFFGVFSYLMSPNETNRNVCAGMMDVVFTETNRLIKEPIDVKFYDKRLDDETAADDEATARIMFDEASLATMTNYVSMSVEYKDFVQDRLSFIFGANLSGTDFTDEDGALCDAPKLFVLIGQC